MRTFVLQFGCLEVCLRIRFGHIVSTPMRRYRPAPRHHVDKVRSRLLRNLCPIFSPHRPR